MYKNPLEMYQSIDRATMSDRETEARVLTEAAVKLKTCQENWNAEDRSRTMILRYNQRIWSIFQGNWRKRTILFRNNCGTISLVLEHLLTGEFLRPWHIRLLKNLPQLST